MNTILIILGLVVLVIVLVLVFKKKKPTSTTTTTVNNPVPTTTIAPMYNNYSADVFVCGTCVQVNEPGHPDPIKSLYTLSVGTWYNGGDGFIYFITNSYGDQTETIIPGTMSGVSCKEVSAYGC